MLITRAEIEPFCLTEFDRQVTLLARAFRLSDFEPYMILDWKDDMVSYGGTDEYDKPFIQLGMLNLRSFGNTTKCLYDEYEDFNTDVGIGDEFVGWKTYCGFLIAHELAHVIEIDKEVNKIVGDRIGHIPTKNYVKLGHGPYWQTVYRMLRDSVRREGYETSHR